MTSTVLPTVAAPPSRRSNTRRDQRATTASPHLSRPRRGCEPREADSLGRYADSQGHVRELVTRPGAAGSTLVIDRAADTLGDGRLVAHLAADEPPGNAALVCRAYLHDVAAGRARCRPLTVEDTRVAPFAQERDGAALIEGGVDHGRLLDRHGHRYSLECLQAGMTIPQLRWCRRPSPRVTAPEPVSMREAIACLESYEPVCSLTLRALAADEGAGEVSTTVLRAELARVQSSPIVLNRGLREAVLGAIEREQLSMSEIAIRCGRVKHDRKGNEAGETSWLARRLGLLPEGGRSETTPWIHSDVLALIAREGLGVSPREVEL